MVTYVSQGKFVCAFEELLLLFLESWKVIKHAVSLKGKKKEQIQISEGIFTQIIQRDPRTKVATFRVPENPCVRFYLPIINCYPPPEIHLTAQLCSCIARSMPIQLHSTNSSAKKLFARLVEEQRTSLFHFLVNNKTACCHIITTLALLTVLIFQRYLYA